MPLAHKKVADTVQSIFIQHFHIAPEHFDWEKPLEELHVDFKILANLVYLEQLIEKEFVEKIPLLENISTAFHTPKDIVELIINEL